MIKFATCPDCKKSRPVSVEVVGIFSFDPAMGYIHLIGSGDIIVRCNHCYVSLHGALNAQEVDELIKAAYKALEDTA